MHRHNRHDYVPTCKGEIRAGSHQVQALRFKPRRVRSPFWMRLRRSKTPPTRVPSKTISGFKARSSA
jgi:hypothetical protein